MLSDMALLYPNSLGAEGSTSNGAAFANPGDGPGSASPLWNHFAEAPSDALLAYMESCHVGSWQRTLNDNTSTRPEWAGGATALSVTACKKHSRRQALPALLGNACWICPIASTGATESDSAFPARAQLNRKPTSLLAASLLPTSSWRILHRCFYAPGIGTSRSRSCSRTCQTLSHPCQCPGTAPGSIQKQSSWETQ